MKPLALTALLASCGVAIGQVCVGFEVVCSAGKAKAKAGMSMGMGGGCRRICVRFSQPALVPSLVHDYSYSLESHSHGSHGYGGHNHASPGYEGYGRVSPRYASHSHASHGHASTVYGGHIHSTTDYWSHRHGHRSSSLYNHGSDGYRGRSHRTHTAPVPAPIRVPIRRPVREGGIGGGKMGGGGYYHSDDNYYSRDDDDYNGGDDNSGAPCRRFQAVCGGGKAMAKAGMGMASGRGCRQVCVEFESPVPELVVAPVRPRPSHSHSHESSSTHKHGSDPPHSGMASSPVMFIPPPVVHAPKVPTPTGTTVATPVIAQVPMPVPPAQPLPAQFITGGKGRGSMSGMMSFRSGQH